jgi:hypothetical protein
MSLLNQTSVPNSPPPPGSPEEMAPISTLNQPELRNSHHSPAESALAKPELVDEEDLSLDEILQVGRESSTSLLVHSRSVRIHPDCSI